MAEIAAIPWNGFRVVSTFSGCGGSCLGYRMAGYKVVWASEFVAAAREVYELNHPDTLIDAEDIRNVTGAAILEATGLQPGDIDVLDGSPPCASFSTSGKREEGWGKVKHYSDRAQRTDDLFFEYARLIRELRPRLFIAENVSGLVIGVAKGYFKRILAELKACGYTVQARVLDAQWLGVPQMRKRVIFIGVRSDLERSPVFPRPLPYLYTVRDAFADLPPQAYEKDADISNYAIGPLWDELRPGQTHEKRFNLTKPSLDRPCYTVVATGGHPGTASVVHPLEKRKFTIPELKRICGFPDDFALTGKYEKQWERLGRAVPPVMMMHIAAAVRDEILCPLRK